MINKIVLLVVFLLSTCFPVYADTLSVDVYGSYNFVDKALTVFWKPSKVVYPSYKLILNKITLTPVCGAPELSIIKTVTTNGNNITFTNLVPDYYKVVIKGLDVVGNENLIYSKDFFIALSSIKYAISWCNGQDDSGITNTVVYTNTQPSFEFTNPSNVPDFIKKQLSRTTEYFETLNMVFINKSVTDTSEPSGQLIIYSAIPYTPTWQGLKDN